MPSVIFSDPGLRALPIPASGQRSYWDEKLPTFGIRVSQGGSKTFVLNRNRSLITIGRYPVIGLSEARAEAKRLLAEFTLGKVRPHAITYSQAVRLFLEDKQKNRRPRTTQEYKRLLDRLPLKGRLDQLREHDIAVQLAKFAAPAEYNHLLVAFRIFENWCKKRGYLDRNLTAGLSKHGRRSRERVLSDEELKKVWEATDRCGQFGTIVKLLILTGQRRTEIASLQSSWIHDNVLTFPAETTKSNRQHTIPLEPIARQLLPSHGASLLFPARGRHVPFNGWSNSKALLDKLSGVTDWTLHDLRRTFATHLAELGVAPHVIERLLNHVTGTISGVAAIYNRYSFMDEMRAAVERWEVRLQSLIALQRAAA